MKKTDLPDGVLRQSPRIHESAWVAPSADIIGDVGLHESASGWFSAVLRGDIQSISVGARSNIQDGVVVHVENDRGVVIGESVTIGHRAVIHGCTIESGVLIGMGAIILNGAVIQSGAAIGAGTVIKENTIVGPNELWVGVPGRYVKTVQGNYDTHLQWAEKYVQLAQYYRGGLAAASISRSRCNS
jgi:carbonic anhydrase/acetyltransferase-like protein (isoleucine patch superfamily)